MRQKHVEYPYEESLTSRPSIIGAFSQYLLGVVTLVEICTTLVAPVLEQYIYINIYICISKYINMSIYIHSYIYIYIYI